MPCTSSVGLAHVNLSITTLDPALQLERLPGLDRHVRGGAGGIEVYGDLGRGIEAAISSYAQEVRERAFPGAEHVYAMKAGFKPLK